MASGKPVLDISNLHAGIDDTPILRGIELEIPAGEIHAIMGRNGSGKTTTANIIMGHPDFEVTDGGVQLDGEDLLEMEPWERARAGVFLSFQYPQAVPGLQVGNFLRKSVAAIRGEDEKKRFEILQLMLLQPKLAILDETDSGLDIDGIRTVAKGINAAVRGTDSGALIITHYSRILEHVQPDRVHVLIKGRIVKSGGPELALELEERGYEWLEEEANPPNGNMEG